MGTFPVLVRRILGMCHLWGERVEDRATGVQLAAAGDDVPLVQLGATDDPACLFTSQVAVRRRSAAGLRDTPCGSGYDVRALYQVDSPTSAPERCAPRVGGSDMTSTRRLPPPHTEEYAWQGHAACRGMNSEVFFVPPNVRGPALREREAHAKNICAACPVQRACREHALNVGEPYGIWGGLTPVERAQAGARIN